MNKKGIEFFARTILGCGCEPEVFQLIEKEDNLLIPGAGILKHKILIGKRLLIYVYEPSAPEDEEKIGAVIRAGITERDANNYNRFRLTLVSSAGDAVSKKAAAVMDRIKKKDPKVHLHVFTHAEMSKVVLD